MIVGLVPACGLSRRMGRSKLILPIEGRPLLERVIVALGQGGIDRVLVVAPPPELEGADHLARIARSAGAEVVVADSLTPDMRSTVELGLARLRLDPPGCVALTPADAPGLSASSVAFLSEEAARRPCRIVVPIVDGRRGHPLILPWPLALEVFNLPRDVGVNALLREHEKDIDAIAIDDPGLLEDLDTPEDYRRWTP